MNNKYTIWGFSLIAVILVVFMFLQRPTKAQLAQQKHDRDSIMLVKEAERRSDSISRALQLAEKQIVREQLTPEARQEQLQTLYGTLACVAAGEDSVTVVENEVMSLSFASKGGTIAKAELKNYTAYNDTLPLVLFDSELANLCFDLLIADHTVPTSSLYFTAQVDSLEDGNQQVTMRCALDTTSYIDFVYTIRPDDYMLNFSVQTHGMQDVLMMRDNMVTMHWKQTIRQQERGRKFEEKYAQLQYMHDGGDIDKLSESKNDSENVNTKLKWIAYKDQYFSTVLIAEDCFEYARLNSEVEDDNNYIKTYETKAALPFYANGQTSTDFRIYLGPNHYNTLKAYDKGVEKANRLKLKTLVPLGWKVVAWINQILVIPMFDLFTSWGLNIGIVILLMTLVIKLIILPFTFTSYRSSAKMRVLKPQIDEINAKYPADKMQERQQATMALYSKAGVSPMSGCLPMLFQFPILMAMFWFLPTAIELRGQSFLWANDLSAPDSIWDFGRNIPLLGDHLSLFCLLMTALNIVYSVINMQTQATAGGPEMKMMKWMMYLMPVMFFFIFNDYAAGLSYYYLVSLIFTILQTYIFRWSINDEKLKKQMEAKAAKNAGKPKKTGLMARLEKMQREQQQRMKEQVKKQQRR